MTIADYIILGFNVITFIGVVLVIRSQRIQNTTLKAQVAAQGQLIAGMQQYQNIIKLDEVEKYVGMRERTISQQSKEEKEKIENELKQTIDSQFAVLNDSFHQVQQKTKELDLTKENLDKLNDQLSVTIEQLENSEKSVDGYVERIVEFMDACILLIATYIPKDKWQEFVDKEIILSKDVFAKNLFIDGEKIYEEAQKAKINSPFLMKIMKSTYRNHKQTNFQFDGSESLAAWIKIKQEQDEENKKND